jgi:hypothetical protein
MTSQVCAPRWPILWSSLPSDRPAFRASTMSAEMPCAPLSARFGAGHHVKIPASGALVMYRFVPFST